MYDAEKICTAIITELEDNLPAKLDAIDTEKNDGITLENPKEYYLGEQKVGAFPAVIVQPMATDVTLEGQRYGHEVHLIEIYALLVGSEDADTLTKRVLRTVRGIQETLEDNPQLDGNVNWMRVVSKDYSPTIWSSDNQSAKDGRLIIEVRTTD